MVEVASLPSGTLTFVFTDIEGSTEKWDRHPKEMAAALRRHNELLAGILRANRGHVFKGTGDGFCAAFASPAEAARTCFEAQLALLEEAWPVPDGLRVRMAVHTGLAEAIEGDYYGPALNRAARILSLAHGGQVLAGATAATLAEEMLDAELSLRFLAEVELPGLLRPERVYQLCHARLNSDFPPLRTAFTPEADRHNIPADERPFVGRTAELAEIAERLRDPNKRLLTITGVGGIGKSRLAKRAGTEAAGKFRDGAWFIPCDTLLTREEVAAAARATLPFEFEEGEPETALVKALRPRETLLIFDCFEGSMAAAPLLREILKTAPKVKILVTSRTLVGLDWEHELPLGPMERPKSGTSDAARLFAEAAEHVQVGFEANARNRALIGAILDELEGVPLAIVLAAGRLRHMSLAELRDQLRSSRLDVLKRKAVAGDRHAELRRVIEDSFTILPPEDQALAVGLSVFEGGFSLEDALAVMGSAEATSEGINRLRDHSLLTGQVVDGRMRFRTLDTIREYLGAQDSVAHLPALREAHARHFAAKARSLRALYDAGNAAEASASLWADAGNYHAAVRFAADGDHPELAAGLARGLARAYLEAGAKHEFEELARLAESAGAVSDNDALLIEIRGLRGARARRDGDLAAARKHWESRAELAARAGDTTAARDALLDLADLAFDQGDESAAVAWLTRFDATAPLLEEPALAASADVLRARLALQREDKEEAARFAHLAHDLIVHQPPGPFGYYVWRNLAGLFRALEEWELSLRQGEAMLDQALVGGQAYLVGKALFEIAETRLAMGDVDVSIFAILTAGMVPRTASPVLRAECRRRRASLAERFGEQTLDTVARAMPAKHWTAHAESLLQSRERALKPYSP